MKSNRGVYFEVHGQGQPLLLGFPIMASYGEIFGADQQPVLDAFLTQLTDAYQVIVCDYPALGRSDDIPPHELTIDRVLEDLLSVADAAGWSTFAYWGYAWGAMVGLQLASRTDRVSALAVGGWPPLGGQYADLLKVAQHNAADPPAYALAALRNPQQYEQWVTFNTSLQDVDERAVLDRIRCPRLVYVGAEGDVAPAGIDIRNASVVRANQAELERLGWTVELVHGHGHGLGLDAAAAVPVVRPFLDRNLRPALQP